MPLALVCAAILRPLLTLGFCRPTGRIVDLDAGAHGLEKRHPRGRRGSRDGDGGDVENFEPPVLADGPGQLECHGGVLSEAGSSRPQRRRCTSYQGGRFFTKF